MVTMAVLLVTGALQTLLPGVAVWVVLVALIGLPVGLGNTYFISILQGIQRITAINLLNLAQNAVMLLLTVLLVAYFGIGLLGVLMAHLLAGLSGLGALVVLLRREGGRFVSPWDGSAMRSTLSFGFRGQVGNILQFFNYRLDMLIVNYLLGPGSVGIYTVSVGLAEVLWYFPNAVGFVIFPKAASTEPRLMNVFTPRILRKTLLLTAFGALVLALAGETLILMIYSSPFLSAYTPMLILLPGVVFLGSAKVLTNDMAGRGYPHYNSLNAGLALVITVGLDIALIPRYGVPGAALASSIAYTAIFVAAVVCYIKVSRKKERPSGLQPQNPL
jgi:O-antigen/teichoic acid export membrane protein